MESKSYCFFDFDNTLYKGKNGYLILDFPEFLAVKGLFNCLDLKNLQDLQFLYKNKHMSRDDFAIKVLETYYKGLAGKEEKDIFMEAVNFFEIKYNEIWFPYSLPLIQLMNKYTTTILVSGSPYEILELICEKIDIKILFATRGIIDKGVYTGEFNIDTEMATYDAKKKLMDKLSKLYQFNTDSSFAFGASESDFPLFDAVNFKNSYLIGENEGKLEREVNKDWNIVKRDKVSIEVINQRLSIVFPKI